MPQGKAKPLFLALHDSWKGVEAFIMKSLHLPASNHVVDKSNRHLSQTSKDGTAHFPQKEGSQTRKCLFLTPAESHASVHRDAKHKVTGVRPSRVKKESSGIMSTTVCWQKRSNFSSCKTKTGEAAREQI
ncbi:hypothetical protein ILYODFUR_001350 [Ilyodon furcidens]|uniref:Uncharacterized protein n=1 Tax=Ilyodon furcidens TaxID=33524 RepID=A0ABV0U1R7_9TELE